MARNPDMAYFLVVTVTNPTIVNHSLTCYRVYPDVTQETGGGKADDQGR